MRIANRTVVFPATVVWVALASLPGCDGGAGGPRPDASATEVKLTGKVVVNGAPAKGGSVTFDPGNNYKRAFSPRTALITGDGTYEITTMTGPNIISVNTPETAKDANLGYNSQTVDVRAGSGSLDIQVPAGGSSAPATKPDG
jgi:hypothetical protein